MTTPTRQRQQALNRVRRRPRGTELQPPGPNKRLPTATKRKRSGRR